MHRVAEVVNGHKSKEFLIPKKLFGVWKPHSEWTNFKTGRQKGEEAEIKVEVNSACRCCLPQNGPGVLRLLSSLIISTKVIQSISQWILLGANEWDTANQAETHLIRFLTHVAGPYPKQRHLLRVIERTVRVKYWLPINEDVNAHPQASRRDQKQSLPSKPC